VIAVDDQIKLNNAECQYATGTRTAEIGVRNRSGVGSVFAKAHPRMVS
jgi:hypothetical protein